MVCIPTAVIGILINYIATAVGSVGSQAATNTQSDPKKLPSPRHCPGEP